MTRRTAAWMPLYIEAYDRKTIDLSAAEDGVYLRLLRHYWVSGPLPDDDVKLARIARVERREWAKYRPSLIGFFSVRDGRWFQNRADEELAKAQEVSEKRAEAGAKGGRPRKHTESKEKPNGFSNGSQTGTHARVASHLTGTLPSEGEEPPGSSQPHKRGRRIPNDWVPTDEDRRFAANEGLSPEETGRAADEFRDYWRARAGRDACKLDWSLTFRNRLRQLADRKRERGPRLAFSASEPGGRGSGARSIADLVLGPGASHGP